MFSNDVKWVRMFDITDIAKHQKGFTIYKVISMLYPENAPNAVTKITVWKRFNDFKTLHKDIKTLHKCLKIKDQVPNLPTSTYFKRFDEDVIQHRKGLILELLEYISLHSQLFTSSMFVKFFETSHTPDDNLITGDSDDECTISDDTDSLSTVSSSMIQLTDDTAKADEYPIKFQLFIGDLQLYSCELFGNSLGSELVESEYICHADRFFELAEEVETLHKEFKVAWKHYMQGIYILLKYGKEDKVTDRKYIAKFKLEKYFIRVEKLFYLNLYVDIESFIVKQYGELFANIALADLNNLHFEQLFDLQKFAPMSHGHADDESVIVRAEIGPLALINYPISTTALRHSPHDAEEFAAVANKFENEQNYAAAYVNYKMAFMEGNSQKHMKNEGSDLRYLLRNEKYVYRGDELLSAKEAKETISNLTKRNKRSDLCNYKVTDLIDNQMIVINTETEQKYIVKVVQKTLGFSNDCMIFPKNVPYMTKLQRWHSTDDAVFLLFTYTNTTTLTEYLSKYTNSSDAINCDTETKESQAGSTKEIFVQSQSSMSDDFEFIDMPSSASSLEESDEYDECCHEQKLVPMDKIRKWMAQIVLALERLHKCGVVCCDLKLQDVKIDDSDKILLDYKYQIEGKRVYTFKEHNLMAPEVYTFEMATPAADWWSLGVILYEILIGTPLNSINPDGYYAYPSIKIPKHLPQEVKSLLKQLLVYEPNLRLGCGGSEQVKSHPFFTLIRWELL